MTRKAAPPTLAEALAENVAKWREVRSLTQQALAQKMADLGFTWSQITVTEIEGSRRRRRVSIEELLGLSHALGLSALILISDPHGEEVAVTTSWSLTPNAISSLVQHGSDRNLLEEIERSYTENLASMEAREQRMREEKSWLVQALKEVRSELAALDRQAGGRKGAE